MRWARGVIGDKGPVRSWAFRGGEPLRWALRAGHQADAADSRPREHARLAAGQLAALIGFRLASIEPGQAVIEFEATERHSNPMGTLHGGILCDIADAAMGMAYASTLKDGETFTTLELKINFLKPVWKAKLQAAAKVIKAGWTIGLVECDVRDEHQQLIARVSSTCLTLRGDRALGR